MNEVSLYKENLSFTPDKTVQLGFLLLEVVNTLCEMSCQSRQEAWD